MLLRLLFIFYYIFRRTTTSDGLCENQQHNQQPTNQHTHTQHTNRYLPFETITKRFNLHNIKITDVDFNFSMFKV